MIELTIQLTLEEYKKVNYRLLYKKPLVIIINVLGVLLMLTGILGFFLNMFETYDSLIDFILGFVWCTYLPAIVVFRSKKLFNSNKQVQEEIKWTIKEDLFILQGTSFKSEFNWSGVNKIVQLKDFVLIYMSKATFHIMPNKSFKSTEDMQWLLNTAAKNNTKVVIG